jgi:hypothetical protein
MLWFVSPLWWLNLLHWLVSPLWWTAHAILICITFIYNHCSIVFHRILYLLWCTDFVSISKFICIVFAWSLKFSGLMGLLHWGRMVVKFTTTYAISTYHHKSCEFESHWWQGVLDTTLCDKVCQWLATGLCFSSVSPTNKTGHHKSTI